MVWGIKITRNDIILYGWDKSNFEIINRMSFHQYYLQIYRYIILRITILNVSALIHNRYL